MGYISCARPISASDVDYKDCYYEDISAKAKSQKGWLKCESPGYYLAGINMDYGIAQGNVGITQFK